MSAPLLPPIGMLAELTHRCPLQCPYCSNPTELLKANRELDTETWLALFDQAADLGVLQVHLSGGEPTLRRDLEQLVAGLSRRGVYTNLITAGVGIAEGRIEAFAEAGLDHLQLSFQGARAVVAGRAPWKLSCKWSSPASAKASMRPSAMPTPAVIRLV